MLDNIKSSFFKRILFSFIDDERKLRIIKYNKNIWNILDINIMNYQILFGKYVIVDNKGKEYYYNREVLFDSEYLNTKRKGKIEEYDYYGTYKTFEGEYLNGKRNGKGKEFYRNGRLKFEGEYLNGKRNGKGKEYNANNILLFEGEYLNGKKWNGKAYNGNNIINEIKNGTGFMKDYDNDWQINLEFEGEYINGERYGKGKEYDSLDHQLIFEGEYLNGEKWNGKFYNSFEDELKNGKGYVKKKNSMNSLVFESEYLYGKKHGKGKEYVNNGVLTKRR